MPNTNKLAATTRTEFGKGAARRLRRDGQVPAVLYGHGTDPVHLSLPAQEAFLLLRQANALIELNIEGQKKPVTALPRQITRHPISRKLEHVDLIIVKAGEKVTVDVPLVFVGEPADREAMVNTDINELTVEVPATAIPEQIEVSVEGMEIGDAITVADLKLPEGVVAQLESDVLVVNVVPPPTVDLEVPGEEDEGEGEEDGEAAEEGDAEAEEGESEE